MSFIVIHFSAEKSILPKNYEKTTAFVFLGKNDTGFHIISETNVLHAHYSLSCIYTYELNYMLEDIDLHIRPMCTLNNLLQIGRPICKKDYFIQNFNFFNPLLGLNSQQTTFNSIFNNLPINI